MDIITIIFIGIGLAMDAFAVSISAGVTIKQGHFRNGVIIALYFGMFQALMPVAGWLLGSVFAGLVLQFQHWISFAILSFIGLKMIYDTRRGCDVPGADYTCHKTLLLLAIATSIDAFTVGVSFSLGHVNIIEPVLIIGIVTFLLSLVGVYAGKVTGCVLKGYSEWIGGLILIGIGIKILFSGLKI